MDRSETKEFIEVMPNSVKEMIFSIDIIIPCTIQSIILLTNGQRTFLFAQNLQSWTSLQLKNILNVKRLCEDAKMFIRLLRAHRHNKINLGRFNGMTFRDMYNGCTLSDALRVVQIFQNVSNLKRDRGIDVTNGKVVVKRMLCSKIHQLND